MNEHIVGIETLEALNMEELTTEITLKNGDVTTTLKLISAEWDTPKTLNLSLSSPAGKSVGAITACNIKNAVNCSTILEKLCSLRQTVSAYRAKELRKQQKHREERKRKAEAGAALVNPVLKVSGDSSASASASDSSDSNSEKSMVIIEDYASATKKKRKKRNNEEDKAGNGDKHKRMSKRKRKKPEGPAALGQGQIAAEKTLSLAQVLNKMADADLQAATAAVPRVGTVMEIKAWEFLTDRNSFKDESEELRNKNQKILQDQGAKDPSDLRLMGTQLLENMAKDLKGVPARAVRKVIETCSQE